MQRSEENPFATRFTRPGYRFVEPDDVSAVESLTVRFLRNGKRGQIVGPHGCGKTSLVYAMTRSLQAAFRATHFLVIRRQGWFGFRTEKIAGLPGSGDNDLWVVDGVENLSPIQRWCLVGSCRFRKCGLLLTTHQALLGVPVLEKLIPTFSHFEEIVEQLTRPRDVTIQPGSVREAYELHGGDYREGLMFLYDVFQQQRLSNTR